MRAAANLWRDDSAADGDIRFDSFDDSMQSGMDSTGLLKNGLSGDRKGRASIMRMTGEKMKTQIV